MNNQQILNNIVNPNEQAVFKSMREDMETGKALLNPEQLGQFLREATINNTILKDADFSLMQSFKKQLNRVGLAGRVLQNGYDSTGATNSELTPGEVEFGVNELDAQKLKALCSIEDDEKEDNMTKEAFEQTLLSMMGERIGEDLEAWALFGDSELTTADQPLFATIDGWIKTSETKVQSAEQKKAASDGNADFDLSKDTVESMFDAMIYAMPLRFRQNRTKLKFYVPYEVEDAYRNILKSRGTALGDSTQVGFEELKYKNIPVVYCPTLDAEDGRALDDTATSLLVDPSNLAYGIWKNVSIEPDRLAKYERTDYYYRIRGDVDHYFRNATVTAKITADEAAALPAASKV